MARHTGKPSGVNKSEGTGVPSDFSKQGNDQEKRLTREFTDEENDEVAEQVRTNHPNRNVDKPDATNAGGYRQ